MALSAGRLRHRIDIQEQQQVQDPNTGQLVVSWVPVWQNVHAEVHYYSTREMMAAKAAQSEATARIVIRYRKGLNSSMRIVHKGVIFNPTGFRPDPDYGTEYLTTDCTTGVNDGETAG